MIVGSLLLILVAVAMLGLGLVQGSNAFLVGSIAASLLAAVALVVGARRAAGARATVAGDAYDGLGADEASPSRTDKRAVAERAPRESTRRRTENGAGSGSSQRRASTSMRRPDSVGVITCTRRSCNVR